MKENIFLFLLFIFSICFAKEKLYVVCTTQDLADFVKVIGKEKVDVFCLTYGWQDPHRVELRPSMVAYVRKADLVVKVGMDLDSWIDSLIFSSGNSKVFPQTEGYLDCSEKVRKLDVPKEKVDKSMGDIHIHGNPHYWLSPENAKIVIEEITKRLSFFMPNNSDFFKENMKNYFSLLDQKILEWKQKLNGLENRKIVSYHKTFVYFCDFFGLTEIATIEPKPSIPPSVKHIEFLISFLKQNKPKVILHENFYPIKTTRFISEMSGIRYEVVAVSVGGKKEINNYVALIEQLVEAISK
ncbi:MAG: metal ABC transporter substrate-binding protein [Endomicrobia bacterium]|nr:metal ABC transporter substrate-binding protein [Endomicrobiia bacterium]